MPFNSHVPTNRLYVSAGPLNSSIVDSNNLPVPWVADSKISVLLSQPGKVVLRDMGEHISDPNPDHPYSSILRKIKLITSRNQSSHKSTILSNEQLSTLNAQASLYTGYIRMGNQPSTTTSFYPSTIRRLI